MTRFLEVEASGVKAGRQLLLKSGAEMPGPFDGCTWMLNSIQYLNRQREYIPCVSHLPGSLQPVTYQGQRAEIWMINSLSSIEIFFRWLIVQTTKAPDEMAQLARDAYRQLEFVDGCFDGIKKMKGSYSALVGKIVHDLGFLSDSGKQIFKGPWQDVPAHFSTGGVDISDENGKTKKNRVAKRERAISYGGQERYCWWHIKLSPHQNRIHIWPDQVSTGKAIVVGIFCEHLTN